MKTRLILLATCAAFAVACNSSSGSKAAEKAAEPAETAEAASTDTYRDFSITAIDGSTISLKDVVAAAGNKYVLLDFWATWCGPCMGEMPFLKKAYETYHPLGFEIFGCSLDNDPAEWKSVVESNGFCWLHAIDSNYIASNLYGIEFIPSNFLIDCSNGEIVASGLREEALGEKLAELLAR